MGIENIRLVSQQERRADDWRYFMWPKYLALSPSYQLAHRFRTGVASQEQVPSYLTDFHKVLAVYDHFGDVYAQDFAQWWQDKSFALFGVALSELKVKVLTVMQEGEQVRQHDLDELLNVYFTRTRPEMGNPLSLLVSIPLDVDRQTILRTLGEMLTFYKSNRVDGTDTPIAPLYVLAEGKSRLGALQQARRVVLKRAEHPRMPLWQIGCELGINLQYAEELRTPSPIKRANEMAKNVLAATVSRFTRQALCIAENAARGHFPLPTSAPTHAQQFNFHLMRNQTGQDEVLFEEAGDKSSDVV